MFFKDTHREKAPSIKLQRLQKVEIRIFGSLVHQINSLEGYKEVLKWKQSVQKNKVVTGKILFVVIGPFCINHSICFNIGF